MGYRSNDWISNHTLLLDCWQDKVLDSFSFMLGRHLYLVILECRCSRGVLMVFRLGSKRGVGIDMMRLRDFDCENIKIGRCLRQILVAEWWLCSFKVGYDNVEIKLFYLRTSLWPLFEYNDNEASEFYRLITVNRFD